MHDDVERILITQQQIEQRVKQLAAQITADHTSATGADGEITLLPILTGAMIFCADLMRYLPMRMQIGLLAVSSYPGRSVRSQGSQLLSEQIGNVRGRHVLLVDDILDSGGTIQLVRSLVSEIEPASVKTCVLLRKDRPQARAVPVDYVGFDIPDEFVVGYGLDYDDYYRNLPDIVTLKGRVISSRKA